jgi:hypothetical protein
MNTKETDDMLYIPYSVLEAEQATHERNMKRMLIAIVISVVLLFASNIAWLCFFNSFDIEASEITVDSTDAGNANYVGKNGVIDNGRSKSKDN